MNKVRHSTAATFGCIGVYLFLTAATVFGIPPGRLDTTFGSGGFVVSTVSGGTSLVQDAAIQPDGKIVVVGDGGGSMAVARYNANGTPDATFNGTGVAASIPGSASAVALQADGKIVVAGNNANPADVDFLVVRYNTNGTLDTTFDGDGIVVTPIGTATDAALALAIQSDGKILVSGRSDSSPVFVTTWAVVRYNTDGSLDTSFDGDGKMTPPSRGNAIADSLVIQPDGKFVIAHNDYTGSAYALTVLRFNANGSLDATFGTNGVVAATVGTNVEFVSSALQTDGKIVVACSSYTSNAAGYDFWVVRFNADGVADAGFGNGGQVVTPIGDGAAFDMPRAVSIQANGKIVVGGKTPNGSNSDFAAVRYNPNGSLDVKWGTGGIVRSDLGGSAESINAVAIQTNGRIIAAGESDRGSPGTRHFATARYIGDAAESFDYDRDGRADLSVFRPSDGVWYVLRSSTSSLSAVKWGLATDELVSADYDGDLIVDLAVWRPGATAAIYILNSSDNTFRIEQFGQTGDDPSVTADYDEDGKADPAVYRNGAAGQQSRFYYRGSFNNPNKNISSVGWGTGGDIAARGDYNGDGRFDPTVFRPSTGTWYSLDLTTNTSTATQWGSASDRLVPADYDGDGKTDAAIFRAGVWYILSSSTATARYEYWGLSSDTLTPGDYDADGRADVAVFRNGTWYIQASSDGTRVQNFGLASDIPTPTEYLP